MKKAKLLGIIAFAAIIIVLIGCKDSTDDNGGGGDSGGVVSQPPSGSNGPGGVSLDSNGDLRINATVYVPGADGNISTNKAANNAITVFLWRPGTSKMNPDYTRNISDGTVNISIPAPNTYTLNRVIDYFPDGVKSGADVEITNLLLSTPSCGDATMLSLHGNSVFEGDYSGIPPRWHLKSGEEYCIYYSKGDAVISGTGSEDGYSYIIDIKFAKGWNIVCEKEDPVRKTFSIISKSPPVNARWIFMGID